MGALVSAWHATGVAVTLGEEGALLSMGEDVPVVIPAAETAVVDPCGAGDCFAAAAALALRDGRLPAEAVAEGVRSASAFVAGDAALTHGPREGRDPARPGAAASTAPEPAGPGPGPGLEQAGDPWEVARRVRARGGRIVATGGCFDLLHAGHVGLLGQARALGDCLVVCLNSDASVRQIKGPGRPLVPREDRARVLAALDCVDAVMVFDERTPVELLDRLRPDLWVKGGDYGGGELVEAEVVRRHGGEIVLLPYLEGRSTTGLVERAHAARGTGCGTGSDPASGSGEVEGGGEAA